MRTDVEHKQQAPTGHPMLCAHRVRHSDRSDRRQRQRHLSLLTNAGHTVSGRAIVRDDAEIVKMTIERHVASGDCDVDDQHRRHRHHLARQHLRSRGRAAAKAPRWFGELFRMLSYQEIGSAAMMSRTVAGLVADASSSPLPDPKRRRAWRWKNWSSRNSDTSCSRRGSSERATVSTTISIDDAAGA
jgi:molybdenum cofactor biosynthesis protein B